MGRTILKTSFIILALQFSCQAQVQDSLVYPLNKNKIEYGATAGAFIILFTDIELSLTFNRRVSNSIVLEGKPMLGLITQLLIFEGNEERYRFGYAGGTAGINIGKYNKFFEMTTGLAYYNDSDRAWGSSSQGVGWIGTLAYKTCGSRMTFRTGIGWPHGLFIGFNF